MKINLKFFLILALILAVLGGIVVFYLFNKPHRNLQNEKSDFTFQAFELFDQFKKDEASANVKFLNKAVDISGSIKEIINEHTIIIFSESHTEGGVQCELDLTKKGDTKSLKVSDKIKVRGQCDGFMVDVNLSKCVIIE